MTYIKLLTVLAGLALLTACAGGVTINNGEININNGNPCDSQPFGKDCGMDYETARVKKISECLMNNAAASPTCAPARAEYSCIDNPFTVACSNDPDFADYLNDARTMRTTYCQANPDETKFCAESVTFNNVCKDNTDIFSELCFPAENPRRDACLGDVLDMLSNPSCATRPSVVSVCTDDPFTRTGCGNVSTIGDLRTMYCGDKTTAWDDDCVEATYSVATDARNMACLDYGIDATKGGNTLCSARRNVIDACDMDTPFAHPVCNEVANIDRDIRTPFCQMPANAFTTGCKTDGTHGDVDTARDTACLLDLSADTGCPERPNVKSTCVSEPLPEQNAGCANLSNYGMLLSDFCAMGNNAVTYLSGGCGTTPAAVCPTNLFNPSAIIVGGTIDCLGNASFAPARITACATEAELDDCDTTEIAPEVCKDSGANANPFAAFCASATNIGGDKTVTEIRQSALDACPDDTKDGEVGICKNTIMTRATLNMECILIADAFKPQCAYTQFNDERMGFCNDQSTAWDAGCDGETTYAGTTAMRDAACLANPDADATNTGNDLKCGAREAIILACPADDPFAHPVCDKVAGIDAGFRTAYCTMQANAFKTGCKTDGTHDPVSGSTVSDTRFIACLISPAGTPVNPLCKTDSLTKEACISNGPFASTGCANLTDFPMIVKTYCESNPTAGGCAAKYSTWTDSFSAAPLATAPVDRGGSIEVGFLSGLTKTQPTIAGFTSSSSSYVSATLADHNLEGDTNNGFAIWFGSWDGNVNNYYSGILTTTDVGTPLNNAKQGGTWNGRILAFNSVDDGINKNFTFTVNFGDKEIYAFVASSGNSTFYEIEGSFEGGLLTGSVEYGQDNGGGSANGTLESGDGLYVNGTLTGLIGADGAVGAFIGKTVDIGFSGGFVAVPPVVNTGDLPTYPTKPNAETSTRFLTATETGLNITDIQFEGSATRTILTPHFIGRRGLDSNNPDGFAYFVTTSALRNPIGYVGILPTTNLGAPLIAQPANAVWAGHFSVAGANNIATNYFVDFTNGKFGFSNAAEDDTDGTLTVSTATYTMNAHFGSHASANGYSAGRMGGTISILDAGTTGSATIVGLIGAEGAVGVFTQEGAANGYTGGFTATNPN